MNDDLLDLLIYEISRKDEENKTLYSLLNIRRPIGNKFLSLITLAIFILVFMFYIQINHLLAFFVFLLFLFWYTRSDLNIFAKRYGNPGNQKINCFNDAQNLIIKGNFEKANEVLSFYRNIYNDEAALILKNITLFFLGNYNQFIDNLKFINHYNDAFKLLIGIAYYEKENYALNILSEVSQVSYPLLLIKKLFLALEYKKRGNYEVCKALCNEIINEQSKYIIIEKQILALKQSI